MGGKTAAVLRRVAVAAAGLVAVFALPGCGSANEPIDVFAAASLADAFEEMAAEFTAATGTEVRLNLSGSSSLREQIIDGAPVDVFASANPAVMEDAANRRPGFGPRVTMAVNELVLAVPAANPAGVSAVQDLANEDLFVGVCAASVPCGDLALSYFAQAGVDASVDTFEPDVRFVVSRLVDAELDAGMVYASDVLASDGQLATIERATPPIVTSYPIAVVDRDNADAQAFVDFVVGSSGRAILQRWGFAAP